MSSNMSTGQIAGYIIGAVVGYFVPPVGVALGAAIGGAVGGLADPPKGPNVFSSGPRLNDLSVQTASYGQPIPSIYGSMAVHGNVFWLENNQLKEVVSKTSKKSGGKGGGGGSTSTSTTYSYFATFAVGICKGPIAGVRRIWVGPKLIYDAGSNDPGSIVASNQSASLFTLYYGTEDQMPNSRMQSTLGVSNTPAYRGLAYIVFNDFPLKDYGNSLMGAQVKIEVISSITPGSPVLIGNSSTAPCSGATSYDYAYASIWNELICVGSIYNAYSFSKVGEIDFIPGYKINVWDDGIFTAIDDAYTYSLVGTLKEGSSGQVKSFTGPPAGFNSSTSFAQAVDGGDDCIYVQSTYSGFEQGIMKLDRESLNLVGYHQETYNSRPDNVCVKKDTRSPTLCYFSGDSPVNIIVGVNGSTMNAMWSINTNAVYGYIGSPRPFYGVTYSQTYDAFVVVADYWYIVLAADDGTVIATGTFSGAMAPNVKLWDESRLGWYIVNTYGVNLYFVPLSTAIPELQNINIPIHSKAHRVLPGGLLVIQDATSRNDYLISPRTIGPSNTVTLRSIIENECLRASVLTIGDIDATAITDSVRGYTVAAAGPIRRNIEPLQKSWPFDIVQSGYEIEFKSRSVTPIATLYDSDIGATNGRKDAMLSMSREMDYMLPGRVIVSHADINREYDIGEQYAERTTSDTVNEIKLEMPIALSSDEAAQKAEVLLYLYWLERQDFTIKVSPDFNYLEPADVILLDSAIFGLFQFRITQVNYTTTGLLELALKLNNSQVYNSVASGEVSASTGNTISFKGPSYGFLLDIPLIDAAMDKSGFVASAYGASSSWGGCTLVKSIDGQVWADSQSFVPPAVPSGYATNSIGIGRTDIIDNISYLVVRLSMGSLDSVTELAMLNGDNHFAYGTAGRWEIIAAKNCELLPDGSYALYDMLRGRAGTEWTMSLHAVSDKIVLLDPDSTYFINVPTSDIGLERQFKFVTMNDTVDSEYTSDTRYFAYQGVNLECLSPVYPVASKNSSNVWTISWFRRTRVGGEWRDLVEVTLGETTESYQVDVYSDATFTLVKRTISVATPTASYSSADQVTDFGSIQSTLYLKIYQLSATVGRGYPLQVTLPL